MKMKGIRLKTGDSIFCVRYRLSKLIIAVSNFAIKKF